MTAHAPQHDHLRVSQRRPDGRRRRLSLRPRLEGLEHRVALSTYSTATTLSISPAPVAALGAAVTLTANLTSTAPSPGVPGGTVSFYDGTTSLGRVEVSGNRATFATSTLALGVHSLTARFNGYTTTTGGGLPGGGFPGGGLTGGVSRPLPTPTVTHTYLASTSSVQTETILEGPKVLSIARAVPVGPTTSASSVTFAVTFNEPVTGVTAGHFRAAKTGTVTASPTLGLSGSGASYQVTVSGISGAGTLGLNLVAITGIQDANGFGLIPPPGGAFAPAANYAAGNTTVGVAVGDLNGDGKPDIVAGNHNSNNVSVLLNRGDGTFAPQVTYDAGPYADVVSIADVDGDGKADVVALNGGGTLSILLGRGDGTLAPKSTYPDAGDSQTGMTVTDLNGDGRPDIVTSKYYDGSVNVLMNKGGGSFAAPVNYRTTSGAFWAGVADLNGDGRPDIVSANWDDRNANVFLNKGDGTFAPAVAYGVGYNARDLALGDLNGDGKVDLATADNADGTLSVLLGRGDGTFAPRATYASGGVPSGLVITDVDGDGSPDLATTNFNANTLSVLKNNGNGTFAPRATYAVGAGPRFVATGDLNGDGLPDFVTANRNSNSVSVLLGQPAFKGEVYVIAPSFRLTAFSPPPPARAAGPIGSIAPGAVDALPGDGLVSPLLPRGSGRLGALKR